VKACFSTIEEVVEALTTINGDYERHCHAARAIAEAFFDARLVLPEILTWSTRGLRRSTRGRACCDQGHGVLESVC
jgi:hypothetical protein